MLEDNDYISIGNAGLMFTAKDFFDRNSVLEHVKKLGEVNRPTKTIEVDRPTKITDTYPQQ